MRESVHRIPRRSAESELNHPDHRNKALETRFLNERFSRKPQLYNIFFLEASHSFRC